MNVAIIGCGHAGKKHVGAYRKIKNINKIYVYDTDAISRPEGTIIANNFSDVYNYNNVEIASICTPSDIRLKRINEISEKGIHVLVEKPLALSIQECEFIIESCKEHNVILGVVMQKRFSPAIQQLRGEILAGVLGKPLIANMSVRWCRPTAYYEGWKGETDKGGSILINQAIHHIDILQWVLGPVRSVFGYVETIGHKINTSDSVVATLKFESGSIAVLEASTVAYPKNIGESLTILSEWGHHTVNTAYPGHEPIIRNFVECVREKREPMVTGEESLKSLKIALAIQESSDTGKEIFL
jgi:predicted dehydrogenase